MAGRFSETFLSGVSTWRDGTLHQAKEKIETDYHAEEIKLMRKQHEKEENLSKRIYLVEKFTEIEQHFQQLNADLLTVSKESGKEPFLTPLRHKRNILRKLIPSLMFYRTRYVRSEESTVLDYLGCHHNRALRLVEMLFVVTFDLHTTVDNEY